MDAIGVTPKGLEVEDGVGDTPLLEMVLPGVAPIPVEEGPYVKRKKRKLTRINKHIISV